MVAVVETYIATVEETTLYRIPADAELTALRRHADQLPTWLHRLRAETVHVRTEVVADSEGRTESVSVAEINDPPGTLIRHFEDGGFQVVCADGEAYAVCTLEAGDVFFDEQSSEPLGLCVVAPGYNRRDGRYDIRAVPESAC